jgi:hypothetical protein
VDTISEQKECPFTGRGTNSKVVGDLILSISNVDALPSKKTRIDPPTARSEQCQGGTKSSQHDAIARISRYRKFCTAHGGLSFPQPDRKPEAACGPASVWGTKFVIPMTNVLRLAGNRCDGSSHFSSG